MEQDGSDKVISLDVAGNSYINAKLLDILYNKTDVQSGSRSRRAELTPVEAEDLSANEKEVVSEANIDPEIEQFVRGLSAQQLEELRGFRNDPLTKKIHLTLEDSRLLASLFDENRGKAWAEQPKTLDHLITYLRQLKSVKNLVLMLRQLDNISCSLILILADEIRLEYLDNLRGSLKQSLQDWYDAFIATVCEE